MPTTSPEERVSAVGRAARQGAEKLSDEVQSLQSDLKTLTSKVSHLADEGLTRAKESVSETVLEAEEAVRRNPYSAVAIAVGVGLLLGIFLRR